MTENEGQEFLDFAKRRRQARIVFNQFNRHQASMKFFPKVKVKKQGSNQGSKNQSFSGLSDIHLGLGQVLIHMCCLR